VTFVAAAQGLWFVRQRRSVAAASCPVPARCRISSMQQCLISLLAQLEPRSICHQPRADQRSTPALCSAFTLMCLPKVWSASTRSVVGGDRAVGASSGPASCAGALTSTARWWHSARTATGCSTPIRSGWSTGASSPAAPARSPPAASHWPRRGARSITAAPTSRPRTGFRLARRVR
jgi:hypothetical protein